MAGKRKWEQFRWTKEAEAHMERMYVFEKMSAKQISEKLCEMYDTDLITRNAVVGKIDRKGLYREPLKGKPRKKPFMMEPSKKSSARKMESQEAHKARSQRGASLQPKSPGLSLLDIGAEDCRFPYGDNPPYTFCGHPIEPGKAYCKEHQTLCHQRLVPKES